MHTIRFNGIALMALSAFSTALPGAQANLSPGDAVGVKLKAYARADTQSPNALPSDARAYLVDGNLSLNQNGTETGRSGAGTLTVWVATGGPGGEPRLAYRHDYTAAKTSATVLALDLAHHLMLLNEQSSEHSELRVIDLDTGSERWLIDLGDRIPSEAVVMSADEAIVPVVWQERGSHDAPMHAALMKLDLARKQRADLGLSAPAHALRWLEARHQVWFQAGASESCYDAAASVIHPVMTVTDAHASITPCFSSDGSKAMLMTTAARTASFTCVDLGTLRTRAGRGSIDNVSIFRPLALETCDALAAFVKQGDVRYRVDFSSGDVKPVGAAPR